MVIQIGDKIVISTIINDNLSILEDSEIWTMWMRDFRNFKRSSVMSYAKSLNKFWIWSLNNSPADNERFSSFESRYRKALIDGFCIYQTQPDGDDTIDVEILLSPPMTKKTINKELAAIRSYFTYTEKNDEIEESDSINRFYEKLKISNGFMGSIGLKQSDSWLNTFGKRKTFLSPYKIDKHSHENIKAFPLKHFRELLSIASPREKLIYLLCGACSARIGQALCLTLYDIDYHKKEVWLIDPKSDETDIYNRKRYGWLKSKYNIDAVTHKVHGAPDLQFKYPIPLKKEPLYWITDEYRKMFFDVLPEYIESKFYKRESQRKEPHPFLFVTSSGERVRPRHVLRALKNQISKITTKSENKSLEMFPDVGLHGLRHMYGVAMGELYARTADENLISICQHGMGHSRIASTMVYFDMTTETKRRLLEEASKKLFGASNG